MVAVTHTTCSSSLTTAPSCADVIVSLVSNTFTTSKRVGKRSVGFLAQPRNPSAVSVFKKLTPALVSDAVDGVTIVGGSRLRRCCNTPTRRQARTRRVYKLVSSGRYSVEAIVFHVGDEEFSFPPGLLEYLLADLDEHTEPGSALHAVLTAVEDALEPGYELHFGAEHVEAIADRVRDFSRVFPELGMCADNRRMLAAVDSSSRN